MWEQRGAKPAILFVLAVALTVPIAVIFAIGGPGAGLLAAGVVAVILVIVAIRAEPRDWMVPMHKRGERRDRGKGDGQSQSS